MNEPFELDNFCTVMKVCRYCQEKKKLITIIGYPGAGKTVGLATYARNHKNVFYLKVLKSMKVKDFYIQLLESMGLKNTARELPPHFIMNKIVGNLNQGDKNLIIIDEAGKFKPDQLEYIHELRDRTQHTTGIVLAGPEYFKDNLDKWKEDNVIGIPELYRRILTFVQLKRPTRREVNHICKSEGIKDNAVIKRLYDTTDNFGSLMNEIELELETVE